MWNQVLMHKSQYIVVPQCNVTTCKGNELSYLLCLSAVHTDFHFFSIPKGADKMEKER